MWRSPVALLLALLVALPAGAEPLALGLRLELTVGGKGPVRLRVDSDPQLAERASRVHLGLQSGESPVTPASSWRPERGSELDLPPTLELCWCGAAYAEARWHLPWLSGGASLNLHPNALKQRAAAFGL